MSIDSALIASEPQRRRRSDAEQADVDAVMARVVHDLRSPVNTMTTVMRVLLEQGALAADPVGQDLLARGLRAGQQAHRLIDALLAFSSLRDTPSSSAPRAPAPASRWRARPCRAAAT